MRVFAPIRLLAGLALVLPLYAAPENAAAQTLEAEISTNLSRSLQNTLEFVEGAMERPDITDADLQGMRQQLEFVAESALRMRSRATQSTEETRQLLTALGPKPGESEPAESARVSAERDRLEELLAEYQGRIKTANVILARVDVLRARMVRAEIDFLAEVLSHRTETPLAPGQLARAVEAVPRQLGRFSERLSGWWQEVEFDRQRTVTFMWWLVMLVLVVAVVVPTRNWVLRRYGPDVRDESPSYLRRFKVMVAVGLGNVVLPIVSIVGLYVVLLKSAGMTREVEEMATVLMVSLGQYFLITGLSAAALSPGYPQWRISRFTNESAVSLYRSIRLFAAAIVAVNILRIPLTELFGRRELAQFIVMDATLDPLHTVFSTIALTVIAVSMLNTLRRESWLFVGVNESGQTVDSPPSRVVRGFFTLAKAGLVLSIAAMLLGYVNFGIYLAQRIVRSLLIVALAYLVRTFFAATCEQAAREESDIGYLLRNKLDYTGAGATRLMFWVMLVVDLAVSVTVIVALLLVWGVHITDVQNTVNKLLYGINVGSFTVSLVEIGIALGIFIVLFFCVRLFQGFLSNRVLAQTVPDVGVRDALTTGVGYAGIIVAAVVAISSLGLELSQLAIIFGALSVGIGFGLQHVVNNFVSGLILLMHRPIKSGDWIVVGQHEGYVKKINVVATELQTFDNAAVIVPNSQLVSSEVMNWTHKSTVARVIVSVRVSYDSDPRRVQRILMGVAEGRDDVLSTPAPVVLFRDFGDSGLVFELRFFIREADYMLVTASDLRFAITDAFRDAGVTIPFPQRDIHIKYPGGPADESTKPGDSADPATAPG